MDEPTPDRPAPPKQRVSDPNAGRNKLNWLKRVVLDKHPSALAKNVATLLATVYMHSDRGCVAWPSVETVADALGYSGRSVRQAFGELVTAGHLAREHRAGSTALYRMSTPDDADVDEKVLENLGKRSIDPGTPLPPHPGSPFPTTPEAEFRPPRKPASAKHRVMNTGEGIPGNIRRARAALDPAGDDLFGSAPSSGQAAAAGVRSPKATRKARKADDAEISAMLGEIAAVYPEGPYVPARDNLAAWRRSAGALRSALRDDSFENILAGAKAFGARNPDQQFVPRPTNWLQRQDWRGELRRPPPSHSTAGNCRSPVPDPVHQIQRQRAQIREQASAAAAVADRFEATR